MEPAEVVAERIRIGTNVSESIINDRGNDGATAVNHDVEREANANVPPAVDFPSLLSP